MLNEEVYPVPIIKLDHILKDAIDEDIGKGDITTNITIEENTRARGLFIAKENFLLAGGFVAERLFTILNPFTVWTQFKRDGEYVKMGELFATVVGDAKCILAGERVALNFLSRLSGIATLTDKIRRSIGDGGPVLLDTRKTTPLIRPLEKYAVRVGGGKNHRLDLSSGILIKDNHIKLCGDITKAVKIAKKRRPKGMPIEVEAQTIEEVKSAVEAGVDIILLDNMSFDEIRKSLKIINKRCMVEVSGIRIEDAFKVSRLDVDFISLGALTHSARWVDINMDIERD